MRLFLSPEHLEAIVELLNGLISILCVSANGEGMAGQWSTQKTHIYWLSSMSYKNVVCGVSKQLQQ